jgi:hypothetical protein
MRVLVACVLVALVVGCADRPPPTKEAALKPDEVYHNSLDKKTYVAPGGWKTHQPEVPRPDEPGRKVKTEQVRLLTSEADIAARTDASAVAAFLREAERLADVSFGSSGKWFRVVAQFTCTPAGHEVKLAYEGDATRELVQAYHDALVAARKLPVRDGEVSFQLELSVNAVATANPMKSLLATIFRAFGSPAKAPPNEFVTQVLEPTGGTIPRPKDWVYTEGHHGPTYVWTLSREDSSGGAPYTTGVRIQTFWDVQGGTGKTAKEFVLDFVAAKKKQATKVIGARDEQDQGLFTCVGLETEEGPHRILYSCFWGNDGLDVAVVSVAGTTKELWEAYRPTFDRMATFELIDMRRFEI